MNCSYPTKTLIALAAGALLLSCTLGIARADDPAASRPATPPAAPDAPRAGNHYQGQVTGIDATAKTFVIQTRFTETPMTVKTDAATKIQAIKNVGMAGLKIGDHVIAQGQISPDQTTLTARQIHLLAVDTPVKFKVSPKSAGGTVATVSPTLTLTVDGKTVTVVTNERTRVMAPQDAAFGDLAVGNQVEVTGAADGTAFAATSVTVTSPRPRRRALEAAPAPPADTPPPAASTPAPAAPDAKPAPATKPGDDPLDTP